MSNEILLDVEGIADRFICEFLNHKWLGCSTETAIDLAAKTLINEGKIAAQNTKERAVKSPNKPSAARKARLKLAKRQLRTR